MEDLPGMPPDREVEFTIDLVLGVALISIPTYKMGTKELDCLNKQLGELLQKCFIKESVSP